MLGTLDAWDGLDLVLLTGAYWLVDFATRRDGVVDLLRRVGVTTMTGRAIVWTVPTLVLAWFWRWSDVPQGHALAVLATTLAVALSWKATTRDIDVVFGDEHGWCRPLLAVAAVGVWFSPAALLVVVLLLSTPYGLWQHHATLPMRVLQVVVAWLALVGLCDLFWSPAPGASGPFVDATSLVFFVLTIQVSHYLITALAKMWLGPKWYSWVTDNRLHHLAATSYSWGWARFVPWPAWRRYAIGGAKAIEKPMQCAAFSVELFAPLAVAHPFAAVAFGFAWAGFHVGVFALSGLLFWDWIVTDVVVAITILALPASVTSQAFGLVPVVAALAFMAVFPLRHKLWRPIPLGWWDTPFTQRMTWRAHGVSGAIYGVYNDFMCPNERLYGKVHACFLAPAAGITYHLGEVWKHELRDAIRDAGPDPERLDAVRERFGVTVRDEALAANHVAYLRRFFGALNRGARKHVLPRGLRWLKAPGDQVFYWGDLPKYRGQEPVTRVSLRYREEYFDGESLVRLRDEHVLDVAIDDAVAAAPCRPEPTPKEIDDLLLDAANGRLIDLPNVAGGYVAIDDGKAVR